MSQVVSFRLSKENPREAKAYEILNAWRANGYSMRHTITQALLTLDGPQAEPETRAEFDELSDNVRQVRQLLAVPFQSL
jgi:hypothetical protein